MDKLEIKVSELEKEVAKVLNWAKIILVLAVIFGISGGWGYKLLSDAKSQLTELQRQLNDSEKYFSNLRSIEEQKFVSYINSKAESYLIETGKPYKAGEHTSRSFWNGNTLNTVSMKCPDNQFLTGIDVELKSAKGVRTPHNYKFYCAKKSSIE